MFNWLLKRKKIIFIIAIVFLFIFALSPTRAYAFPGEGIFNAIRDGIINLPDTLFGGLLRGIAAIIFYVAELLFRIASYVWEFMIPFSLGLKGEEAFNPYTLDAVNTGWKLLRDISNMVFIFIMIYLSISIILGIEGGNVGRVIASVIVVALLVNFSLAISKTVIDASNLLAVQFWQAMSSGGETSEVFIKPLNFESLKSPGDPATAETEKPSNIQMAVLNIGGAVFLTIAAFVFMAGGFMFLMRSFTLTLVLIFSPLAFAAYALGKTEGYGTMWLNRLLNEAFFAPLYLIIVWIALQIITSDKFATFSTGSYAAVLTSTSKSQLSNVSIIFSFGIIIFLLTAAITVAKSLSATSANFGTSAAGTVFGAAAGTAGLAGRQTIGRMAKLASLSDVGRAPGSGRMARLTRLALDSNLGRRAVSGAATGSFDIRTTGVGGLLAGATGINIGRAGGQGGFQQSGDLRTMIRRTLVPPIPPGGTDLEQAARAQARTERSEARQREIEPGALSRTLTTPQAQSTVQSLNSQELANIPPGMLSNLNFVRHLTASQLSSMQRSASLSGDQMRQIGNLIRGNAGMVDPSALAHVTAGPSANLWT